MISFKKNDVLSEISHYKVLGINFDGSIKVLHIESNEEATIGKSYTEKYIKSADYYTEEVKVGKEDKKDGTLGIRSIWENIHSSQVFTVCFKKQNKPKSQKKLNAEISSLIESFSNEIDNVKNNKKGVANCAKQLIEELVKNPILPYEEGEDRVLRGYKIQFESRDGRYDCVDMDITNETNIRPVNINTIKWLIYNGVKYVVV